MSSEWRIMTLNQAGVVLIDCDHKTPKAVGNGQPYIGIPQLKNGRITLEGARLISPEDFSHWRRKALPMPNDVILSRRCNPGETAYVPEGLNIALGQNLVLLRATNENVYPPFLRWLAQGPAWWTQVNSFINVGAVFDSLKCVDIPKFLVNLPPYKEQIRISEILCTLDDKIQINEQVNQTLEQMAQALFKSWFVDFEPVKAKMAGLEAGGSQEDATLTAMTVISGKDADALAVFEREHPEQYVELKATAELFPSAMQDSELGAIPEGWMVSPTSAHYNISIGKTPPRKEAQWFSTTDGDLKWVSIKDMGIASTYISETSERLTHEAVKKFNIKVMPANTVFLSFKLTVGRICITTEDMCSNEAIAHFIPKENKYKSHWLYHALHSFDFNKLGSTSSIATAVNSKTIRDMKLIFPNELISQRYTEKVSSLMQLQKLNAGQINSLTLLRDTLLPKLLSGEITLAEAEQAVSEAENV